MRKGCGSFVLMTEKGELVVLILETEDTFLQKAI